MIVRIHATTVVVSNQDAALDFYVNTLGWTKVLDQQVGPEMRFLTVTPQSGGTELALADPHFAPDGRQPGGYTGISLISSDIDADYATLSERGVEFSEPVQVMPWGAKGTWFRDPDGNQFFLAEES